MPLLAPPLRRITRACQWAIAVLALARPVALHAEVIDRVLAVAAGELIMLSDVTAARDLQLVKTTNTAKSAGGRGDEVGEVLSKLIDRALILAQVDRYAPPEPSAEALDRELQRVRGRFASSGAFAAALSHSGIDEGHLREMLREDLRIRAYEEERFTVPPPSDVDLSRYYREHPQMFTQDGRLAPFEEARSEIARALMEERRTASVASWVAGLRSRADITDLYSTSR